MPTILLTVTVLYCLCLGGLICATRVPNVAFYTFYTLLAGFDLILVFLYGLIGWWVSKRFMGMYTQDPTYDKMVTRMIVKIRVLCASLSFLYAVDIASMFMIGFGYYPLAFFYFK